MSIRHALPADVDTLADIEAASYPPQRGHPGRASPGVWLSTGLFLAAGRGRRGESFRQWLRHRYADLTDEMYDDPIFTRRRVRGR